MIGAERIVLKREREEVGDGPAALLGQVEELLIGLRVFHGLDPPADGGPCIPCRCVLLASRVHNANFRGSAIRHNRMPGRLAFRGEGERRPTEARRQLISTHPADCREPTKNC